MNEGKSTDLRKLNARGAVAHCNPDTPVQAFDREAEAIRQWAVTREVCAAALRSDDPKGYLESFLEQAERAAA
jgi:hypothetical protein